MFVGLVISSTVTAGSELTGDMSTHVENLAEEFAKRAEKFYKGQGWL
jgi:ABC-type phosphate transport system substrate-binding protein